MKKEYCRQYKNTELKKCKTKEFASKYGQIIKLIMKHFFYKNHKILLDTFETQISKSGRKFRLSGLQKNGQVPEKWIDGVYKNNWIHSYIFLDNQQIISFEFDYFDKYVGEYKNSN